MTTELDRFKTILATISLRDPELKLGDALLIAVDVEKQMHSLPLAEAAPWTPNPGSLDELIRWAREQPTVVRYHLDGKKIHAIKEIRALSGIGLKEAKEVYETAF